MIDIEKAKKYYKEYISNFDLEQPRIALKAEHIYRTSEKAKWISQKLELSKEDKLLAELIGLLHDIGRFEQVRKYDTFLDKISVNHGEYGVKVLFENNLIRNFIEDFKYDEIIKKSILNHNRDKIEEGCNDMELLHCKIIRDADKLDIFEIILSYPIETTYPLNIYPKDGVTKEIKNEFIKNHRIDYSNIKTCADLLVGQISYIFDINYIYSLEKIKEENYLEKIIDRFGSKDKETLKDLEELKNIAEKYIQEKIEEGEICLKNY